MTNLVLSRVVGIVLPALAGAVGAFRRRIKRLTAALDHPDDALEAA